jgi:hypothetical protein
MASPTCQIIALPPFGTCAFAPNICSWSPIAPATAPGLLKGLGGSKHSNWSPPERSSTGTWLPVDRGIWSTNHRGSYVARSAGRGPRKTRKNEFRVLAVFSMSCCVLSSFEFASVQTLAGALSMDALQKSSGHRIWLNRHRLFASGLASFRSSACMHA